MRRWKPSALSLTSCANKSMTEHVLFDAQLLAHSSTSYLNLISSAADADERPTTTASIKVALASTKQPHAGGYAADASGPSSGIRVYSSGR